MTDISNVIRLKIKEDVLSEMSSVFAFDRNERGFLLGSSSNLNQIDCCQQLLASQSGMYFYKPNPNIANKLIYNWGSKGICFCGFIHSHVVNKDDLSENDIEFAHQLFGAYALPVLWFGIGIVGEHTVNYQFYSVTGKNGKIQISPVDVEIITDNALVGQRRVTWRL